MRTVPRAAIDLVARFEGLRLEAYPDPATGGDPWTIGYGSTGPSVKPGLKISRATAEALLKDDLAIAARRLAGRVPADVLKGLTDNQYAALLSFVFNLGADPSWTLWKLLKAGDLEGVPAQIRRFVYAGKKKLKGLVARRNAEADMFAADLPAEEDEPPSAVTRVMDTPPAPEPEKPLHQSKTVMTGAAAAVVSAAAAVEPAAQGVKAVSDAIAPFASQSAVVSQIWGHLGLVAAGLAALTVVFAILKNRKGRR